MLTVNSSKKNLNWKIMTNQIEKLKETNPELAEKLSSNWNLIKEIEKKLRELHPVCNLLNMYELEVYPVEDQAGVYYDHESTMVDYDPFLQCGMVVTESEGFLFDKYRKNGCVILFSLPASIEAMAAGKVMKGKTISDYCLYATFMLEDKASVTLDCAVDLRAVWTEDEAKFKGSWGEVYEHLRSLLERVDMGIEAK